MINVYQHHSIYCVFNPCTFCFLSVLQFFFFLFDEYCVFSTCIYYINMKKYVSNIQIESTNNYCNKAKQRNYICYKMRWFFKFFDFIQSFLFIIYINDFDSRILGRTLRKTNRYALYRYQFFLSFLKPLNQLTIRRYLIKYKFAIKNRIATQEIGWNIFYY